MELNLLQKDELVETLAREFYAIQGYQPSPNCRMQSSTHQAEKSCVAMALFAIQKFQSLDCVSEEEDMQSLTDTQKVTDWFCKLWRRGDRYQIKERVRDIINANYIEEDEADKLGQFTWEDFTSFQNITKNYPLPEIDASLVDWKSVGVFIHDVFSVRFHQDDY